MKHFLCYSLFFFCLMYGSQSSAQLSRKVLFLGNSYTQFNNLPQLIADVALSVNDTLIYDSYTPGGYKLLQHSTDATSQAKIAAGGWHYVVLQGQSQEPVIDEANFYGGAAALASVIKQYNPCAVTQLYMTWGRKNGDSLNCPVFPAMCTYESMDTTIKRDYLTIADWYRMEVSPVSVVWKYLRTNFPGINLYQADESHPSAEGSYAAACSFYASLFKKDPSFVTYNFGLNATDAAVIRNAAKLLVFDSLSKWDYKKLPVSEFAYTTGPGVNQVLFTNTSQHADSYLWNFGDGNTSTQFAPNHSYAANGTYTVSLTATNCDLQGLHSHTMDTVISFCNHTPIISPDTLMLCPGESDTLWTQGGSAHQWYNNGLPIPGANNAYLVVTRTGQLIDYAQPSVYTTNSGCSELSQASYVGAIDWTGMMLIGFMTEGNVLAGDKVCQGETLKLITQVAEPHQTQWYKNGLPIPSANSDTLLVNNSGMYKVQIIHPLCSGINGYSDSVNYTFISCTVGLPELASEMFARVYPNPASEQVIVELHEAAVLSRIQLFDARGMLVKEHVADRRTVLNVADLPKGLYVLRLKGYKDSQKFLKE